jgi:hypothetical protein
MYIYFKCIIVGMTNFMKDFSPSSKLFGKEDILR